MGTLFKQPPRFNESNVKCYSSYANQLADMAIKLSKEKNIELDKAIKLIELAISINDMDTKDEQLAGFGKILQDILHVLDDMNDILEDNLLALMIENAD